MQYNEEQTAIHDEIADGASQILSISALAGTGKSTTLRGAAAGPAKDKQAFYFVFNKTNAEEAKRTFPGNCRPMTAHSYAFNSRHPYGEDTIAETYKNRLLHSSLYGGLKSRLDEDDGFNSIVGQIKSSTGMPLGKTLMAIGSILREYCQSDALELKTNHVNKALTHHLQKRYQINDFSDIILSVRKIWNFMIDPKGDFPIDHSAYLKLASLNPSRIPADFIFFDEAQDASPPMIRILESQLQYGTRLVLVGDSYQHIYDFTGAVDAMSIMRERYPDITRSMPLTSSYRFGQEIADSGNLFLEMMGSSLKLKGLGGPGEVSDGRGRMGAAIFRTNAELLRACIASVDKGYKIHVAGGTKPVIDLVNGLSNLYYGENPRHPDLVFFKNWEEFKEVLNDDFSISAAGFGPVAKIVEENRGSVEKFVKALESTESHMNTAQFCLGTAFKLKGFEFNNVLVHNEFVDIWESNSLDKSAAGTATTKMPEKEELALQYVAVTRAKQKLYTDGLLSTIRVKMRDRLNFGVVDRIDALIGKDEMNSQPPSL